MAQPLIDRVVSDARTIIADRRRLRGLEGWCLALLSDTRGQAAVLHAVDALIEQRRA